MSVAKNQEPPIQEPTKGKKRQDFDNRDKTLAKNNELKQSMVITIKPFKLSPQFKEILENKSFFCSKQRQIQGFFERKNKRNKTFPMLKKLLKSKLIQLSNIKRPEKVDRVNDPNYQKYHCLISHPVEKCFMLKDKIMELHSEGKIEFKLDATSLNLASMTIEIF